MTHGRAAATGAHTPTRPDQPADAVTARQATDPDVDLHVPQQRQELRRHPAVLLATIAAGGALGALGRYGLSVALPHPAAGFPWSTFVANVSGAFLIGALMVLITEVLPAHPLLRPFLAVGVLGGYTTFSTSIVDTQRLVGAGAARTALLYLVGTLACAVLATLAGSMLTRAVVGSATRSRAARRRATDSAGADSSAAGSHGSDSREPDPREPDPREPDPREPDPREPDPREPDPREPDPRGPDSRGPGVPATAAPTSRPRSRR